MASEDDVAASDQHASRHEITTAVFSRKIRPGKEARYERWAHNITAAASRYPGYVNATVLKDPQGEREYHVIFTFSDEDHLRGWLESSERRRWLAELDDLVDEDWGVQHTTGLETWFELPGTRPPPRWKMWAVSLLAIFPLAAAFQAFVLPHIEHWPLLLRAAVFPLVVLTMMTFVVMPVVTRLLRRWLRRTRP